MKKLINFLLTLVLITPTISYAQQCPTNTSLVQPWAWPAHSNWYFGDGNIHNFNTGVTTNSDAYNSYEGVSSVSDDQGNLLFYTNGRNLWDASGNLTSSALLEGNEGGATGSVGSASQGVITIRHPFSPDDYYVLTTDDALGSTLGLNYVIVGKDGQVKSGPTRLGRFRTTEGIAATLHKNGVDVWVTVQSSNMRFDIYKTSSSYYTYLLTCDGFSSNPIRSKTEVTGMYIEKERSGLAFSPDGSKFVQGHPDYWPYSEKEITIYDFDNLTGKITNHIHISPTSTSENPYDITFSPDGQMVYFTSGGTGVVWSIDVSSGVKSTMISSLTNTGFGGGGFSAIEIGPDGQIYTGGGSVTSMGGANLGTADLGLPTMYIPPADSVEIQPVGDILICDLPLNLNTLWYCKATDAENTPRYENAYSMELSAGQHTLNSINGNFNTSVPGEYRVRFQICNVWDTLTFNVIDCKTCDLELKKDVEICLGETLLLDTLFNERSSGGDWSIDSFPPTITNNDLNAFLNKGTDTIFDASSLYTKVGTYKLVYTINDEGIICEDSIYITVNSLPKPDLGDDEFICFGSSINIDGGDYYSFDWLPNKETSSMVNVSDGGEYIVNVVDFNGCPGTDTINVTVVDLPNPDVLKDVPFCLVNKKHTFDISSFDNGNGPFTYSWIDNSNEVTLTSDFMIDSDVAGYYWVDVIDKHGCVGRDSASLTLRPDLDPTIIGSPLVSICENDSVTLISNYKSSDGYNFNWSTGETTESILVKTSGNYILDVSDDLECEGSALIDIVVNPLPIVSDFNDSICVGSKLTFGDGLINGYNYLWKYSKETTYDIEVDKAGDYERIVTTDKGCKDSSVYTLVVNDLPIVDLGIDSSICEGDSMLINAGVDGLLYEWSSGDSTSEITVYDGMKYTVEVTNIHGCKNTDSVLVTVDTLPIVDLGPDTSICSYQTIQLDAGNIPSSYVWSTGDIDNIIVVNTKGEYSVLVTNSFNCSVSDTITLGINEPPIVDIGPDINVCDETYINIIFDDIDGYLYNWNSGESTNSIEPIVSGSYELTVTDTNGCIGVGSVNVKFSPNPILDLGDDVTICAGDVVILESNSELQTEWNTGSTGDTILVNKGGYYIATISNGLCSGTDTVNVNVIDIPVSGLDKSIGDEFICFDDYINGINLNANNNNNDRNDYIWNTGETTVDINVYKEGSYDVIISDEICSISDTVVIKAYCPPSLYIPNAFTPNGDDINNTFFAKSRNIFGFNILIFDRWGMLIFESDNVFQHWDGTFKGRPVQQDVYVWKICYSYYNIEGYLVEKNRIGTVTVIR